MVYYDHQLGSRIPYPKQQGFFSHMTQSACRVEVPFHLAGKGTGETSRRTIPYLVGG